MWATGVFSSKLWDTAHQVAQDKHNDAANTAHFSTHYRILQREAPATMMLRWQLQYSQKWVKFGFSDSNIPARNCITVDCSAPISQSLV